MGTGRPRLLVTGFGPFPRMPRNPSGALALAVAASPRLRLHGIEARGFVLTTAYSTLAAELDPLLAAEPEVALLIGVAGRSTKVRLETRATSRRSTLFPDVRGDRPERPETRGDARREGVRRTRVDAAVGLAALRRHGLPARASRDAGRYLCNAAYFRALARSGPTLFIHIPKSPASRPRGRGGAGRGHPVGPGWSAALRDALVDMAIEMARQARRVALAPRFR